MTPLCPTDAVLLGGDRRRDPGHGLPIPVLQDKIAGAAHDCGGLPLQLHRLGVGPDIEGESVYGKLYYISGLITVHDACVCGGRGRATQTDDMQKELLFLTDSQASALGIQWMALFSSVSIT